MQCAVCEEGISNPISAERIVEQLKEWLIDIQRGVEKDLGEYVTATMLLPVAGKSIHGNDMRICAHCFTKEIFAWVKAKCPELEETFLRQFNYQIVDY